MAAAQHQLQNGVEIQNQQPAILSQERFIDDMARSEGNLLLERVKNILRSNTRHGWDLMRTCVNQDSPGANLHPGGAGNAIVQAEHHNRETTGQKVILSCIKMDTAIYRVFNTAPYVLGSTCWTYMNGPNVIYRPPLQSECSRHTFEIQQLTWQSLHANERNRNLCLHFHISICFLSFMINFLIVLNHYCYCLMRHLKPW